MVRGEAGRGHEAAPRPDSYGEFHRENDQVQGWSLRTGVVRCCSCTTEDRRPSPDGWRHCQVPRTLKVL